jgi:hypothetical protein
MTHSRWLRLALVSLPLAALGACGGGGDNPTPEQPDAGMADAAPADASERADATPPPPTRCYDVIAFGDATEFAGNDAVLRLHTGHPDQLLSPLFPPSSHVYIAANEERSRISWVIGGKLSHVAVDGTDPVGPIDLGGDAHDVPAWSHGRFAVVVGTALEVVPEHGGPVVTVSDIGFMPSWSPDGQTLVFARNLDGDSTKTLAIYKARPGEPSELVIAAPGVNLRTPAISPDGTKIAYERPDTSGASEIHVVGIDGTGDVALTALGGVSQHPIWSPDGQKLLFERDVDLGYDYDLWTVAAAGGTPEQLTFTHAGGQYYSWAPDGSFVAYDNALQIEAIEPDRSTSILSLQSQFFRDQALALGRCN